MMESKFEFEELPIDLKYKITREFTTKDILHFADTLRSKKVYYGFFKPEILDVRKLLHYMVRGDHNRVQQILKENIHLMFKMGNLVKHINKIVNPGRGKFYRPICTIGCGTLHASPHIFI